MLLHIVTRTYPIQNTRHKLQTGSTSRKTILQNLTLLATNPQCYPQILGITKISRNALTFYSALFSRGYNFIVDVIQKQPYTQANLYTRFAYHLNKWAFYLMLHKADMHGHSLVGLESKVSLHPKDGWSLAKNNWTTLPLSPFISQYDCSNPLPMPMALSPYMPY